MKRIFSCIILVVMEKFIFRIQKWEKPAYLVILVLALVLRIGLALVNREANDPHMEVVQWILKYKELPIQSSGDCWECFQPKLFYASVAALLHILNITNLDSQIVLAQLLNAILGLVMVSYAYFFIRGLPFNNRTAKLLAVGIVALNPGLVSINIQATNDTFAITFSFIAVFYTYCLITARAERLNPIKAWTYLGLASLFVALAVLSKTNALVTAFAIMIALLIKAYAHRAPRFYQKAFLFLVASAALVIPNPLSQYIVNYQHFGTPLTLTINVEKQPLPHFFEQTETHRPGILSIQDGFFTFKLIELLREPQNSPSNKEFPAHRTSFWSLLYARTHFIQFNQWPPSWFTTSETIRNLGRIIYIFALFPSLSLVIGIATETFFFLHTFWIKRRALVTSFPQNLAVFHSAGLFFALLVGFLGFQILYAIQYRIYTVIKAIFIFPAWPSLLFFYLLGIYTLHNKAPRIFSWLQYPIIISSGGLLILYVLDNLALFVQLMR